MPGIRISRGRIVNWNTTFQATVTDVGKMDTTEFRQLCARLNIRDALTASGLFGIGWRTAQRYYTGELDVPGPLARLLRLASRKKLSHEELRSLANKS